MELLYILGYLTCSIVFLVGAIADRDVPRSGANVALFVALSLVWPLVLVVYFLSGRK